MKLTELIVTEQWTDVLERLHTHPKEAETWDNGILPIHCACRRPKVPVQVVESLIKAYRLSLGQKSQPLGLLPLHCALESVSSTNVLVVQTLLTNYKKAATIRDEHERTPLHFHLWSCTKPSLDVVKLLVQANPIAVSTGDRLDRYPLHYAAKGDQWEISRFLVELFPEGLTKKSFGQTPLDWFEGTRKDQMLKSLHDNQAKMIREKVQKEKQNNRLNSSDEVNAEYDKAPLMSWSFERCQFDHIMEEEVVKSSLELKDDNNQSELFKKDESEKEQEVSRKGVLRQDEKKLNVIETFEKADKKPLQFIKKPQEKGEQFSSYGENQSPRMKDDQPFLCIDETPFKPQEEEKEKSFQSDQASVIEIKTTSSKELTSLEERKSLQRNSTICDINDKNNDDVELITQQEQQLVRETIQQEEEELRKLRDQLEEAEVCNDITQLDYIHHYDDGNPLNLLQEGEKDDEVEKKIDLLRHKLHGDEEELRNMRARLREEEESIFGKSYLPSTPSLRKPSSSMEVNNDKKQILEESKKQNKELMEESFALKRLNTSKTGGVVGSAFSPPRKQSKQKLAPEENDFTSRLLGFMTCWSPGRKMQYYD